MILLIIIVINKGGFVVRDIFEIYVEKKLSKYVFSKIFENGIFFKLIF